MLKMNLNVETLKGLSNKEIASALKKELKTQLKGVKFSVTSSIYSINCHCPKADFEANKETIKEVAGMCAKYTDTIYINERIASYFDTKEYKEQQQKEYELQQAELEKKQKRENLYNSNVAIEKFDSNNVKVVNVENKNIFVTALEPALNKNDWKTENDKCIDEKSYLNKYKITDIVYMNEENYNYFCFNLLNDYDFLANKGGSWSDDETGIVEYNCAVCVYCEGKELIIIDPQGYSYARYTNRLTEDINGDLEKEIKRATEQPTPKPPKPTKKESNSNVEIAQNKNNIVVVDFTQKQNIKAEWKQDQATNKQLYALYCVTKVKTTGLKISKGEASDLIGKAKKGVDIKEELKQLINSQNLSIAK